MISMMLLASCDSKPFWRDPPYQVNWMDGWIYLGIEMDGVEDGPTHERVGDRIVAVGSDSRYVVAKQLNQKTNMYYFYYIEKEKDNIYLNAEEITQGPFSESEYFALKEELALPEFSSTIPVR